jgi:hypothetical protein
LQRLWPAPKRALEFAWISGGWDADRDGVMEGVQHNTYDVEFVGPNPLCGIWYLGALRAGEEMARAAGDDEAAKEYRRLFANGSNWIDENLFNGEFYIQKIGSIPKSRIAKGLQIGMGAADTEHPDFQLGDGCLVDQLLGQYFAHIADLGLLLKSTNIRKALQSIYKYNYKHSLYNHNSVQRTFALNDEAGLVICDYGRGQRPRVPFPYFAEFMTGFEYSAAILMLYSDMAEPGLELIENIRRRYDGERRNPWDEAECGYHYARAMASWTAILAFSGFHYDGVEKHVAVSSKIRGTRFSSIWTTGTGWGVLSVAAQQAQFAIRVLGGQLSCRSCAFPINIAATTKSSATIGMQRLKHQLRQNRHTARFELADEVSLKEGDQLVLDAGEGA